MGAADRLDRYRVLALLAELERLAAREQEVRQELREMIDGRSDPVAAALRERFGGKPT
ncbi:MAG TPA: hypothetical protein VN845_04720 [Solirubrobacteraceae bacterium]|nr:hypothetical protein [Solirubrobacteraceae bacterium]